LVFFIKTTGRQVNSRSAVYFLGSLFCICKIIYCVSTILRSTQLASFVSVISYMFGYHCFMALLFGWLTVCETVFRFESKRVWFILKRTLWVLPVAVSLDAIAQAILGGGLDWDLFIYGTVYFYLDAVITFPCILIAAVVMLVAAGGVLHLLNKTPTANTSLKSALRRKIGLACIADSSLTLFIFALEVAAGAIGKVSSLLLVDSVCLCGNSLVLMSFFFSCLPCLSMPMFMPGLRF